MTGPHRGERRGTETRAPRVRHGAVALFSHGHFGRVIAARWIGLSVLQAQHFLLATASLSVLCFEHDRIDQPAIALWNSDAVIDR